MLLPNYGIKESATVNEFKTRLNTLWLVNDM